MISQSFRAALRNKIDSTNSELRLVLFSVMVRPAEEKRRSDGTDVAGIERYLRASFASIG
ncbi:7956_t:CDS:2 [Cetraspora pellucida]|uniref:7956_t:CDS:1 n=1 Tax=Cetraspora pellucida TaxID=1433469 RepID=A0ACA9JZB6_9GLOM|nr:7956_t:CDS:2 [Cetraspora pellucida]